MRVVVAEKPSVARDLGRVLGATQRGDGFLEGSGLRITWCVGHMAELEEPAHYDSAWKRWSLDSLPMVPERFVVRARSNAADQLSKLRRLLGDPRTADVVNACDAGREGELIFRWVLELCGCTKPVLRMWTSSLTDGAIRAAWSNLAPGQDYDRLGAAARCRAEADWLVGLNATRALTCRARSTGSSQLLSVGRVQTPTLAMIVARDREIGTFVPETYFRIEATFTPAEDPAVGTFVARWFRPGTDEGETEAQDKPADGSEPLGEPPHAERLSDRTVAERIAEVAQGRAGVVERADRKRTRERPPLLYDLTSLQRRANQRYGLSAQRTLEIAQALYEQHKLVTYPRTDSRYITPDQVPLLPDVLRGLEPLAPYAPFVTPLLAAPIQPGSRVVNASEVGDHPAILPTGRTPGGNLDADEKRVFDLVARRLIAALSQDALFDQTRLQVAVDPGAEALPEGIPSPLRFRASGRVCAQQGWRAVDPPGGAGELELPPVQLHDRVDATETRTVEGQTRPPRRYNDASVLRAMETAGKALDDETLARALRGAGLGTPATRASVLQTLLDREYVERHGRELRATDKGAALIGAIPLDTLKSAELTAIWEGRLSEMADGRGPAPEAFMAQVASHVREIVAALIAAPAPTLADEPRPPDSDAPSLGDCPRCKRPVRERGPVFTCDTGRSCPFVVYSEMAKHKIGSRTVRQLLRDGRSQLLKGFVSRAGKKFDAGLRWDDAAGKVSFWFPDSSTPAAPPSEPPPEPLSEPATKRTKRTKTAAAPEARSGKRSGKRAGKSPAPPPAPLPALPSPPPVAIGDRCPVCGEGTIIAGRTALGCNRWREGCTFRTIPGTAAPAAGIPSESPPAAPGRSGKGRQ